MAVMAAVMAAEAMAAKKKADKGNLQRQKLNV